MRRALIASVMVLAVLAGPAAASEGAKGADSNLVRMTIMIPLLDPTTNSVKKIVPILIDLTCDTSEVKDKVVNLMPKLQDAFLGGSYGKVYTNWGYDRILGLIKSLADGVVGDEVKEHLHVSIRVNVRPQ